jgi:hypothetical protein
MALGGSTINFYGGQMSEGRYITAFSSRINPEITVYGRNFAVNGEPLEPSETTYDLDLLITYHELTGVYGNGDPIKLNFRGNIPIYLVTLESEMVIDIKPGNDQNNINLKSKGVVQVAVLTTDEFDAATIDPATAEFAGATPRYWSLKDVDNDGRNDLMFHFNTEEINLDEDSTEATLTARLAQSTVRMAALSMEQVSSGTIVSGTDKVQIISSKK